MGYVNLYKIDDNKQLEFTQLLQDKYEFIGEQEYKSLHDKDRKYIIGTYLYRANDSKIPDWQWILDEYECDKVKIYSSPRAILKIESDGIIYVISYGLAYFSVDKYCDVEFAFEFAKRIAFNEIKTTTLTAPNSRKNKIVNVFVDYSNLSYESGESYAKIKARMDTGKEKRLFKETIEIGHSIKAQLIQNNIDSIIEFIEYIEVTLKKPIINKIPVFGKVKDDELIADLDERLLKKINDNIDCINISELDVIGVTEIFNNNDSSFVLKYKRDYENIESLTKDAIMHFIETNKINIEKEFFNIKIACLKNEQIVCTYNIKRVIDFTDDERKCVLIKGEWYQYNSDYIAYLQESIKELDVIYDSKYEVRLIMGYQEKIDLIDYISLFEEVKKCKWKAELVDTFSKYGIKDDTERTGETDGTYKSGKSKDLYAAFVTVTTDNKKYKTHIHFQSNQISINTISLISDDRYFSKYKVRNKTSDEYRNRCFKIPYDVDEFKYVMDYFLRYDENWLNRESETVIDTAEQEDVLKAQLDNSVDEIDKEIEAKQLQGEEREALIKVRVNQSAFRKLLMRRYTHCCLCDVDDESLLVASHIKPWAKSSHAEKVDVNNGLLLCPNHDKLFDRGYISFDNGGHIVISDELSKNCAISMNIKNDMQIELSNDNIKYMEYHRNNVLK